jgi:hypothetical protein
MTDKERKEYMRDYNLFYRKFKKHKSKATEDKFKDVVLSIEPTNINFQGVDIEEPIVCKFFGCGKHLSNEEQRFGNYCINHQSKEKSKPSSFIQFPIKKQTA